MHRTDRDPKSHARRRGRARWTTLAAALPAIALALAVLAPGARGQDMQGGGEDAPAPQEQEQAAPKPLSPLPAEEWDARKAAHLLERAGFGGTPEQIARLAAMTPEQAVDSLVFYERTDQDPDLKGLTIQPFHPPPIAGDKPTYEERLNRFFSLVAYNNRQIDRIRLHWFDRMLNTERPLEEKMVLFWHGHFTTSGADKYMARQQYEQLELFRRLAVGSFEELTVRVSKDPAMLQYLNNNANRKGHPNENYARELMELFTLGVGNYTEQDVKEAARALTGWTAQGGDFVFARRWHDEGEKTFLGRTGNFDGHDIIRIIMEQNASRRFMARNLWEFFAYEDPEPQVVNHMAFTLAVGNWRIQPALRRMFLSREFYSERAMGERVKSPTELLVGTWRRMGLDEVPQPNLLARETAEMGQVLLAPPTVEGWPGGREWITSSTLLSRYNYMGRLLLADELEGGRYTVDIPPALAWAPLSTVAAPQVPEFSALSWVGDAGGPEEAVAALERRFLSVPLNDARRAEVVAYLAEGAGAGDEPVGDWRSERALRRALHLILCTPEYQVH